MTAQSEFLQHTPSEPGRAHVCDQRVCDERLNRIEEKLSLSEDLVESLNLIVAKQQEQIAVMARELQRLSEAVSEARQGGPQPLLDERPPHY